MPKCSDCGTYYVRSFMTCPNCHTRPTPRNRVITEVVELPAIGQLFDGQKILSVHLNGDASLTLILADGSVVDFANWRECVTVSLPTTLAYSEAA